MDLPTPFQESYLNCSKYPENLVNDLSYSGAAKILRRQLLREHRPQLNEIEQPERLLFAIDESNVELPFIDLEDDKVPNVGAVHCDGDLKLFLGDCSGNKQIVPSIPKSPLATKQDPRCRYAFFYSNNSKRALKVTQTMAERLLSYHQVMPQYLELMFQFGEEIDARDLSFSGFHEQTMLDKPPVGHAIPTLGRSGRNIHLCYNLKTINMYEKRLTGGRKVQTWTVRPTAFHHQFDVETGRALWVVTRGNTDIRERIEAMTGMGGRSVDRDFKSLKSSFRTTLNAHLMHFHWASENWRQYIRWLEDNIEEKTKMAVNSDQDRVHIDKRTEFTSRDIQNVQNLLDKITTAAAVIDGNIDVMEALSGHYAEFIEERAFFNSNFTEKSREGQDIEKFCEIQDIQKFKSKLEGIVRNLQMQRKQLTLLSKIGTERKGLMQEHFQMQANDKLDTLNVEMHAITLASQREAIAMRIITIVTLFYLPATFASKTFFSTDVIRYQNDNGEVEIFSVLALHRWLTVALPLTAITLIGAYCYFWWRDKGNESSDIIGNTYIVRRATNPPDTWKRDSTTGSRKSSFKRMQSFRWSDLSLFPPRPQIKETKDLDP